MSAMASASHVVVGLLRDGGLLSISIEDDGVGGADSANGSGLRGLADRVEALGAGSTSLSPPGGGQLGAQLPVGA